MQSYSLVHIKDSIATKLLMAVFAIYFLVTLTVTILHMVAEYYETKRGVTQDLEMFHNTFAPGLALALWNADDVQVHSILKGMMRIPIIVGVKLEDPDRGMVGKFGRIRNAEGGIVKIDQNQKEVDLLKAEQLSELFGVQREIYYQDRNKTVTVGKIAIYSSSAVIFEKVKYGFFFIIFNSIVKTLALWVIFLLVSRKLLSRPLSMLTNATEQLDLDTLERIQLKIPTPGRNELKILEEAFNQMIGKLILAKRRSMSLRIFSGRIAEFSQSLDALRFAFHEICENTLPIGNGILFFDFKEGRFHDHQPHNMDYQFLLTSPTEHWIREVFLTKDQELCVFNAITPNHLVFEIYGPQDQSHLVGGHLVFLRVGSEAEHLMCFYRSPDMPPFDGADVEYMRSMMAEIKTTQDNLATIRHNARMEGELKTASAVQQALFPRELPTMKNLELASFFQSASETGGDWYGFIDETNEALFILIGDVTGHGSPAALVTATASATCRMVEEMYQMVDDSLTPEKFLDYLNRAVFSTGYPDFLMTFFAARIDLKTGRMDFANAGHNFPILYRADGTIRHVLNANARLGHAQEWNFEGSSVQLEEGDLVLFYTDGLIENTNPKGELWSMRSLIRQLRKHHGLPAKEFVESIISAAYKFYDNHPLEDDVTVVLCQVTGSFNHKE